MFEKRKKIQTSGKVKSLIFATVYDNQSIK